MTAARTARMLAATTPWRAIPPIPRIAVQPRMPNQAWLAFLSGPLTGEDWALIGRVERDEITVDDAMRGRGL